MAKINVITTFSPNEIIQEVQWDDENCRRLHACKYELDLRNHATRKALIELGWTPPPEPGKRV